MGGSPIQKMKVALFGSSGQVGRELAKIVPMIAATTSFTRDDANFAEPDSVRSLARTLDVDLIINAAAYTSVDQAEDEPDLADRINHRTVQALAETARDRGITLIHYSTDYVFDGAKNDAYCEDDQTNPLNIYGNTKLAGEEAVRNSGCSHIILRTSWLYSEHGNNFVKTILKQATKQPELRVVDDQFGKPTSARQIAETTCALVKHFTGQKKTQELFHVAGSGVVSWYDFAHEIAALAVQNNVPVKSNPEFILPIRTADYPTRAKRPTYSALATNKLQSLIKNPILNWKKELEYTIKKYHSL